MSPIRQRSPIRSKTTARLLDGTTATSSLGTVLALGKVDEQELFGQRSWPVLAISPIKMS
jgi:hypothetical protein